MSIILGKIITKSNKKKYIKIKRNQLLILDTLLNDGGNEKKYIDKSNNVYQAEDIISNKINPKIIAKYLKDGEKYSIPEFNI